MRSAYLLAAAWLFTLSVPAWSQDDTERVPPPKAKSGTRETPPPPPQPEPAPQPNSEPAQDRDPTVPEGELKGVLEPEEAPTIERPNNVVAPPVFVVPQISVAGKVIGRRGAAVLLNVGKEFPIFVRASGEVTITQDGKPLTLAVLSITPDVVEIEIRPLKRRLTLP